jgi:hypothetical protein
MIPCHPVPWLSGTKAGKLLCGRFSWQFVHHRPILGIPSNSVGVPLENIGLRSVIPFEPEDLSDFAYILAFSRIRHQWLPLMLYL